MEQKGAAGFLCQSLTRENLHRVQLTFLPIGEIVSELTIIVELQFGVVSLWRRVIFIHRGGKGEREMCSLILRKQFGVQSCQTIT